jgi:surface antigen
MSMRNRALIGLAVGAMLLVATCGAQASNLGFLNDTPLSYMKQGDIDSVKQAVDDALNQKQDGETVNWLNEGTGNSVKIDAVITLEQTMKDGDRTCRSTGVVLSAKGQSMNLRPVFCRQGSGAWRLKKR